MNITTGRHATSQNLLIRTTFLYKLLSGYNITGLCAIQVVCIAMRMARFELFEELCRTVAGVTHLIRCQILVLANEVDAPIGVLRVVQLVLVLVSSGMLLLL